MSFLRGREENGFLENVVLQLTGELSPFCPNDFGLGRQSGVPGQWGSSSGMAQVRGR